MKTIEVYYDFSEPGYCRDYYRTVKTNQLICFQEEYQDFGIWYTCVDDHTWNEPIGPIDTNKYNIKIVKKMEGNPVA